MKKILPVFLILCTVVVLALNIFAGSKGGERIAIIKKAETVDMNSIAKDAAFEDVSAVTIDNAGGSTAKAKIYSTWDDEALYFYVEITDPNLSAYVQKNAKTQGKTDKEVISDYRDKVITGLKAEGEKTVWPWVLPAFEIVIDPTNKAPHSSGADQFSKQARVCFDGWLMSYVPGDDSTTAYNCYSEDRYTAKTETQYDSADKVTGYKMKLKFTKTALGLTELNDWDMISVHPFFYAVNADGTGVTTEWAEFDTRIMGSDNWKATHYSFYRLWDPAVNDAKTREDIEKVLETTTTTTTKKIVINMTTTTKATTTTAATTTTPATTAATTTQASGGNEGGCGSVIGTGAIVLMAAMLTAPAVLLKKKKED